MAEAANQEGNAFYKAGDFMKAQKAYNQTNRQWRCKLRSDVGRFNFLAFNIDSLLGLFFLLFLHFPDLNVRMLYHLYRHARLHGAAIRESRRLRPGAPLHHSGKLAPFFATQGRNGHDIDASRNLTTPERQQLRTRQALRDRSLNVEESPRRRSAAPRPKTPTPQPGHVERTRAIVRASNREARTAELLSSPRRKRAQVAPQDENNPQGTNARVLLARYLPSSTPPRLNGQSSQPNVPTLPDHQTPTVGNAAHQRHSRLTSQRERREHERLARIQQASSPAVNIAPQPCCVTSSYPACACSYPGFVANSDSNT
ncbi:hypothetical protein BDZ97DRAFT_1759438 [Flammula alnicola]|nr:hypothetical protein BDZ97DRAFT_1759438 [Flammula alnicola]